MEELGWDPNVVLSDLASMDAWIDWLRMSSSYVLDAEPA